MMDSTMKTRCLANAIRYGNIDKAKNILKSKDINVSYNYNELISRCIYDYHGILEILINHPSFNPNLNQREHIETAMVVYCTWPCEETRRQIEILKTDKRYTDTFIYNKKRILDNLISQFDEKIICDLESILC